MFYAFTLQWTAVGRNGAPGADVINFAKMEKKEEKRLAQTPNRDAEESNAMHPHRRRKNDLVTTAQVRLSCSGLGMGGGRVDGGGGGGGGAIRTTSHVVF